MECSGKRNCFPIASVDFQLKTYVEKIRYSVGGQVLKSKLETDCKKSSNAFGLHKVRE